MKAFTAAAGREALSALLKENWHRLHLPACARCETCPVARYGDDGWTLGTNEQGQTGGEREEKKSETKGGAETEKASR